LGLWVPELAASFAEELSVSPICLYSSPPGQIAWIAFPIFLDFPDSTQLSLLLDNFFFDPSFVNQGFYLFHTKDQKPMAKSYSPPVLKITFYWDSATILFYVLSFSSFLLQW
jgi:hypothetical protein